MEDPPGLFPLEACPTRPPRTARGTCLLRPPRRQLHTLYSTQALGSKNGSGAQNRCLPMLILLASSPTEYGYSSRSSACRWTLQMQWVPPRPTCPLRPMSFAQRVLLQCSAQRSAADDSPRPIAGHLAEKDPNQRGARDSPEHPDFNLSKDHPSLPSARSQAPTVQLSTRWSSPLLQGLSQKNWQSPCRALVKCSLYPGSLSLACSLQDLPLWCIS